MVENAVEAFIKRWGGGISYGGNERANLQMFITEQIAAVRQTLGRDAMTLDALSAQFTAPGTTRPLIVEALAALEELGMVEHAHDRYRMSG